MKRSRANKGQFSIIAALLVAVILVAAVISAYSMIRHAPLAHSPKVMTAMGEMNADIKRILDFTVGYYGSILQVTGNSTYAQGLTTSYLSSGLVNIARSHPEWNPSFDLNFTASQVSTRWYMPQSYSTGNISVTYDLAGLGIEGVKYETSSALEVTILDPINSNEARITVTRDNNKPELGLRKENFRFYKYNYADSNWELINPENDPVISADGTYIIDIPPGVDQDAYSIQVENQRGLLVKAFYSEASLESGIPQFTYNFDWDSTGLKHIYESLTTDNMVIEVLQNGTLLWLGQSLQILPQTRPIPPLPVKAVHLNQTINGVNREVPFQVEDWASDYRIPLGLAGNASLFNNNNMLVFLVNDDVEKATLWWDGSDTAIQTSYAWQNIYFNDDPEYNPSYGVLNNGLTNLNVYNFDVVSSVVGGSTSCTADFLRVNNEGADYGAEPAFVIYNGVVRDIVQAEPEYGGGVAGSPNFYAQVVLTFPANATYYTYAARTIFVNSSQSRTISDLSAIQLSSLSGSQLTEDGTDGGYPVTSASTGLFYNDTNWEHHWSQFMSGDSGAGLMFTDTDNQNLYIFDSIAGNKTGALNILGSGIELNPVEQYDASFTYPLELIWHGAIVTFEGEPIYRSVDDVGLWVMVENPPWITMDGYDYDYVDNNICNVDFSDDKGTHSLFHAQKYGPDSIFDTLAEYIEGERIEDYVDNNTSDVDNSTDVGSHSDFSAQQTGPDSIFDTLTESSGSTNTYSLDATGGYMIVGDGTPDWGSTTGTISFWIKMDSFVQGRFWGQHGDMETRWSGTNLVLDWGGSSSMTSATSFSANTWYFVAIVWDENNNDLFLYVGDETNPPTLDANSLSGTWTGTTPSPTQNRFMNGVGTNDPVDGHGDDLRYWDVARNLTEIQSDYNVELTGSEANLRSYFRLNNNFDDIGPDDNDGSGSGSYSFSTDVAFLGAEVNYELNLEVQFTNLVDFLPTEELCIYAGTLGSEDLRVDYWNGSDWENLATDLTADSWNNLTVSLASTTFAVRFNGGNETSDATQDQWEIDAVLIRSEGTGGQEDTVDNDTSNVDSSSDLGNLTNFDNMKTADSTYANLTESVSEGDITFVNAAEASGTSGTSAQINKPTNTAENDFMMALLVSTTSSGDGSTMSNAPPGWTLEHDYTQSAYSGQHVYIYWKIVGASEPSSYTWTWTSPCGWLAQITTFRGVDTSSPIHVEGAVNQESSSLPMSPSITTTEDNCMIWLYDMCDDDDVPYSGGAPGGTSWIDQTEISSPGNGVGISMAYFVQASAGATGNRDWTLDGSEENSGQQYALKPAPTDYRLDQEVQWTDVPCSLPNEELSIYGGAMGAEDIVVDVWNGAGWETVFTDLSSGWNNVSITQWLTTSNFTIRFRDGTEVGDGSPDTWLIDVALIHVWNVQGDSYELDLEVQWTNVDFDEDNEELCIFGGTMSSENIMVDIWNGSSWVNIFTDLNSGWNNVTVSEFLTSSIFTIRFKGADETSDITQDFWAIDATLLHLWS